ncbi:MAG: hypothetical protein EP347_00385 [Alphaproteobacteria bacterium]|nr:MAG: hypothetical protein EP347_00385 [Alphaproteobacteria bacterium]
MVVILNLIKRLREDTSGVAAIWTTLLAIIVFTLTALAVDGSWIFYTRSRLQATADASVLAAAANHDTYIDVANAYAETNMPATDNGDVLADVDIENGTWDAGTRTFDPAGTPVDAFRVTTRRATANGNALPLFFAQILGDNEIDVSMTATAITYREEMPTTACILTLSELDLSLTFTGNPDIIADGCSIMSNSTGDPSIKQTGSSYVVADCVYAVGEIQDKNIETTGCPAPVPNIPPVQDPYFDIEVPSPLPACRASVPDFGPGTENYIDAADGRFCSNIDIQGTVYLSPGVYYFSEDFDINSGAYVAGTGVTIVLTSETSPSTNTMFINGGAELHLSAPTSGDFSGILFYQDRNITWPTDPNSTINGNANSELTGAIYFPTSGLTINGTSGSVDDAAAGCLQIIADTLFFAGDATVGSNCDGAGTRDVIIYGAWQVQLVD